MAIAWKWDDLTPSQRVFYICGSARFVTFVTGTAILIRLKHQQYRARHGDVRAARAVLLPVYQPMILMLLVSCLVELTALYMSFLGNRSTQFVTILADFSMNQFVQTGLVVFFCSHSLSAASMQRSIFHAFVLGLYGFACGVVHEMYTPLAGQLLFNTVPMIFLWCVLQKVCYRRKSIVPYLKFMIVYDAVWIVYSISTTFYVESIYYASLITIALMECPLSILWYAIMWSDTYFWRTGGLRIRMPSFWRSAKRFFCRRRRRARGCIGCIGGTTDATDSLHLTLNDGDAAHDTHDADDASFSDDGDDSDLDDDSWNNEYEKEAMQRIETLRAQEAAFDRARERRRQAQLARVNGALAPAAVSSTAEASRTPSPLSDSSSVSSSCVSPTGTASLSASSSRRRLHQSATLPPESLLSAGSDLLLSNDIQLLIERNRHRFIDFALLRMGGECIGRGGSSNVYAGFYRNYPVALKFFTHAPAGYTMDENTGSGGPASDAVDRGELTSASIAAYAKETSIAAAFDHPSIVKFIGLCVRPPTIFLVSELCEAGSLFNLLPHLRHHPQFTYQAALDFCVQASASIDYLHSGGFLHRDIKSLNYMVTRRGEVKLTDFGLSRMFPHHVATATAAPTAATTINVGSELLARTNSAQVMPTTGGPVDLTSRPPFAHSAQSPPPSSHQQQQQQNSLRLPLLTSPRAHAHLPGRVQASSSLLTRHVGSRCWMSPEMLHGDAYALSSDVYSLTMVLWEILTCQPPFEEVPEEDLTAVLMAGCTPHIPAWTPEPFSDLLRAGWSRDPRQRPTARQVHLRLKEMLAAHEREFHLEPFDSSVFFQLDAHAMHPPPHADEESHQEDQQQYAPHHQSYPYSQSTPSEHSTDNTYIYESPQLV